MKFTLMVLLVGTMLFCGCKKEGSVATTDLTGTWELRQTQGDMPVQNYLPGNGNLVKFAASQYRMYRNNSLVKTGLYRLQEDSTVEQNVGLVVPAGEFTQRIIYDNDLAAPKTFLDLRDGKLRFLSGFFPTDGGSEETYEKIADRRE